MISLDNFHNMFHQSQSMADTLQQDIERTLNRKFSFFQVQKSKLIHNSSENPSISFKIKIEDEGYICIKNDQIQPDGECRILIQEYCTGTYAARTGEYKSFYRAVKVKPETAQKSGSQEEITEGQQQERERNELERTGEVNREVEMQLEQQAKSSEVQGLEGKYDESPIEDLGVQEGFQDVALGQEQEKGREEPGFTEEAEESIRELEEVTRKQERLEGQPSEKEMTQEFSAQEELISDEEAARQEPEVADNSRELPKLIESPSEEQTKNAEEEITEDEPIKNEKIEESSSQELQDERQQPEKETEENLPSERTKIVEEVEIQQEAQTNSAEEERTENELSEKEWIEGFNFEEEIQKERALKLSERTGVITEVQKKSGEQTKNAMKKRNRRKPREIEKIKASKDQEERRGRRQQRGKETKEIRRSERVQMEVEGQSGEQTQDATTGLGETKPSEQEMIHAG